MQLIERLDPYAALEASTAKLGAGLAERAAKHGIAWTGAQVGAMFGFFFQADPVWDYTDAKRSDTARFGRWHGEMLARGVYLAPSQFEAAFVSVAHDRAVIEHTLAAADEALAIVARGA